MSEAAQTPTTQTPEVETLTTVADRARAIKAAADAPANTDAEGASPSTPATPTEPQADPAADPQADAKAKAAADRAARIRAMQESERQADARRKAHKESRAHLSELEQLRKMKAEWEKNDSAFKDEEAFLAAAEARGIGPEKVIGYFRDRMTNPEAIAERRANATKSDVQKQLDEMREEIRRRDEADKKAKEAATLEEVGLNAARNLIAITTQKAEEAPLVAALYEKLGPDGVVNFANQFVIPDLGEEFDATNPEHLSYLHDHMETLLEKIQVGSPPAKPVADQASKAPSGKKNGEKPITTLSNRIVSERGTVTEEVPWDSLSFDERKRRLKEKFETGE